MPPSGRASSLASLAKLTLRGFHQPHAGTGMSLSKEAVLEELSRGAGRSVNSATVLRRPCLGGFGPFRRISPDRIAASTKSTARVGHLSRGGGSWVASGLVSGPYVRLVASGRRRQQRRQILLPPSPSAYRAAATSGTPPARGKKIEAG